MSIEYCHNCNNYIDTDYNSEHFTDKECEDNTFGELPVLPLEIANLEVK